MGRRTVAVLTVAGVAGIVLAGGCAFRESICSSGEYPVAAVRSTTGRACVEDGQAPPAGFVRFPEGKVPQHVGDEWDRYWAEHMVDENGREVSG
ncbi:SCO0607 family lipoprotein [Micromonospora sp. BQ11]|uniref:SCO0607 family lipoprotein n=1 Tax=Micromonospora sp. BQ11 TaxID=3452212 RepID=UPI003F89A5B8